MLFAWLLCFIQYCAAALPSTHSLAASFPHLCVAAAKCIECCLLLIKDFLCYWPRVQRQYIIHQRSPRVCTCTVASSNAVCAVYNDIVARRRNKSGRSLCLGLISGVIHYASSVTQPPQVAARNCCAEFINFGF